MNNAGGMTEPDAMVMICPLLRGPCQTRMCRSWYWIDDPEVEYPKGQFPHGDCENPGVNPDAFARAIARAIHESQEKLNASP